MHHESNYKLYDANETKLLSLTRWTAISSFKNWATLPTNLESEHKNKDLSCKWKGLERAYGCSCRSFVKDSELQGHSGCRAIPLLIHLQTNAFKMTSFRFWSKSIRTRAIFSRCLYSCFLIWLTSFPNANCNAAKDQWAGHSAVALDDYTATWAASSSWSWVHGFEVAHA